MNDISRVKSEMKSSTITFIEEAPINRIIKHHDIGFKKKKSRRKMARYSRKQNRKK